MKIKIIALGKIKEKFLKDGIDEFLKRLTSYSPIEIIELNPVEIKDENLTNKALEEEGEKILSQIKEDSYVITMEIKGKQLSSEEFAAKINEITISGVSELIFVIGSSCGLSSSVSQRANLKLSMSRMNFPLPCKSGTITRGKSLNSSEVKSKNPPAFPSSAKGL